MAVWSEIWFSRLEGARRVDAEYYQPIYIRERENLRASSCVRLGDIAFITDGQHGYHKVDPESDIKHITAKCIAGILVVPDGTDRLALETHLNNPRSSLQEGDILLSTAGTLGNAGVVTEDVLPANIDQDVARIHIHDKNDLSPWFVAVFLNSEYGRLQTSFQTTGQVQKHLALGAVRDLLIPQLPRQHDVARLAAQSCEENLKSKRLYAEAESLLLRELGLDTLDLSHQLTYERNFSDMQAAGRFDAEYFQPKYQQALAIMGRSGRRIADVARLAKRRFKPQTNALFEYIEIGNLSGEGHAESETVPGEDAPSRAQ